MDKRKLLSPKKNCPFATKCYRANADHFKEFNHLHLDRILEAGLDAETGDYVIPDDVVTVPSKVKEQLEILRKLKSVDENPAKIQKTETDTKSISSETSSLAASTAGQASIDKPRTNVDLIAQKAQEPKNPEAKVSSSALADFFKERRQAFKSKDPKSMQASSPPIPAPAQYKLPQIPLHLKSFFPLVLSMGRMAEKLRLAAPYNMFLTAVTASPPTHSDLGFVTFLELLDPSLGELESSVQLNFTVDITWLLAQYTVAGVNRLPLIVFYGQESEDLQMANRMPNVKTFMIKVPGSYGCHHAKVMLLFYKDMSMRVVISTANLYHEDWDNRVQGIWVSDRLPALSEGTTNGNVGESCTNFRTDLINFLMNYKNPSLQPYIDRIKKSDFSSIKVFLITSIPGRHHDSHGHLRLRTLLKENSAPINEKCPIIMQSSSLGNFGNSVESYLTGEIVRSMSEDSEPSRVKGSPSIKLIYPSLNNVKQSHDGMMGGGCLPYMRQAHSRQPWLNRHLYQWKCQSRNCDRAMPHIKSYCRYSEVGLFWFVLTSANMSKSAWGSMKNNVLNINSYEVGVAFFPRVILGSSRDFFPMNGAQQQGNSPIFKVPYDFPPVPYAADDAPFCINDMMEYQNMLMQMQG